MSKDNQNHPSMDEVTGLTGIAAREKTPPKFGARLRHSFFTGLIIVGPVTITLYILWWFINLVDAWFKPLLKAWMEPFLGGLKVWLNPYIPGDFSVDIPFAIPGLGLIFAIFLIIAVGALATNLFGRTLVAYGDRVMERMPVVRNVYRALKQIFETTLSQKGTSFKQVGIIEYPRPGLFAIVFIATDTIGEIKSKADPGCGLISVFLPTTPNPTSGFLLFVPNDDIKILDMSVEDAAKLVISAGLVVPEYPQPEPDKAKAKAKVNAPENSGNDNSASSD
jgi:uncharacterized membrane protein